MKRAIAIALGALALGVSVPAAQAQWGYPMMSPYQYPAVAPGYYPGMFHVPQQPVMLVAAGAPALPLPQGAMIVQAAPAMPEMAPAPAVVAAGRGDEQPDFFNGQDTGRSQGLVGGGEILFLKPHNSEGVAPIFDVIAQLGIGVGALNAPEFDLEPAWRVWLGYQGENGLGGVIRYFEFDRSESAQSAGIVGTLDLDYAIEARTLDIEGTNTFRFGPGYYLTIGSGFRYAEYQELNTLFSSTSTTPQLLTGFESESYGLVVSADMHRRFGSGLALYLGTRVAAVYGDEDEILLIAGLDLSEQEKDNVKFLWEGRAGGEYTAELSGGGILFVRLAGEVQYWDKVTGVPVFNSNGSFGLAGFGLSVGVYR
jgi:hypothetical protein